MIQRIFVAEAVGAVITMNWIANTLSESAQDYTPSRGPSPVRSRRIKTRKIPVRTQTWWISYK